MSSAKTPAPDRGNCHIDTIDAPRIDKLVRPVADGVAGGVALVLELDPEVGGDGVTLTGDFGSLSNDADSVSADLLADHDVGRYPGGAVIGRFPTGDIDSLNLRDPEEIEADPYPFDNA